MGTSPQRLIIVGAGPKAMAIASKNAVLQELGFAAPEIHIVEKDTVGAHWTGRSGYTSGRLQLGTPPEKDVGFPYASCAWGPGNNEKVDYKMKQFSWQTFLVATKKFSEWVDQGRPAPEHREWAQYLQWVGSLTQKRTRFHQGQVTRVDIRGNEWVVGYETAQGETSEIAGEGLVLTGPGKIRFPQVLPANDNLLTVESFWKIYRRFENIRSAKVAIVGTGETAAAVAMGLVESGNESLDISVVSPHGMTFTRGESFRENQVYTDAEKGNWSELSDADRRAFIQRTDRGVFSVYAQKVLDRAANIRIVPGRSEGINPLPLNQLEMVRKYNGKTFLDVYDYVIIATGGDPLSFLNEVVVPGAKEELLLRSGLSELSLKAVETVVGRDLSVEGLFPKLHLPMLSGLRQGPGYANLSCLGQLSDRILEGYVLPEKEGRLLLH